MSNLIIALILSFSVIIAPFTTYKAFSKIKKKRKVEKKEEIKE